MFNRWGEVVFESKGSNNPWNGYCKGSPLPSATYYYVVDTKDYKEGIKSGSLTIVR